MIDRVTKYAEDVLNGVIITGELVKQACKRHLDDLESSKLAPYVYEFDIEKSVHIINFAEMLTIAEGEGEVQVKLQDWQSFILGSLNGWVKKESGYRKYRSSYIQIGRQNGKSFLNGIIAAYYSAFSGYKYGQLYCTATKEAQAIIVWNEIMKFVEADKDLEELFDIKEYCHTITALTTKSTIKTLGRDTKSIDGFRPLIGIVDEYHAHKDNQMYKLLEGGTRNLKQCLISVITTAGFNLNGPCFEEYEYCKKILGEVCKNETKFIYIAQMDEEDDTWDPKNWIKANPLVCSDEENLENLIAIAFSSKDKGGGDLKDFLTKGLNVWVEFSKDQYIGPTEFKKCGTDKTLDDFRGETCFVGLDLSSGGDLTSLALIFVYFIGEERKYFVHSHSFIPKRRVQEHMKTDGVPYDIWINKGLLTVTETSNGIKTDYKYIFSYLKKLIAKYDLKIEQLGYDPHYADTFLQDLDDLGCDCIEIYQSNKYLNDPTEDFRLEVKAENIEYNKGDELLLWSVVNARIVSNPAGEIKINKDKSANRIDPVDATICAYKLAFKQETLSNFDVNKYADEDFLNKLWR